MCVDKLYDTVIIGAGAAGLSGAVYASRAGLDFIVLESGVAGGQMLTTSEIDNYPGFLQTDGAELSMAMRSHAEKLGAKIERDRIVSLEKNNGIWCLIGEKEKYNTKTVIIATGARHKPLGVDGETEFKGRGVSYCAVCDGMFFRNKIVAVVGGGNTAAEEALYLSGICSKVYLIHRRDKLRANAILTNRITQKDNIEILWNSEISSICGDARVNKVVLKDGRDVALDGVFVSIGVLPVSETFVDVLETDNLGFIVAAEDGKTSADGIFAAGDVRTKELRQIITAASDGANAVISVEKYIDML